MIMKNFLLWNKEKSFKIKVYRHSMAKERIKERGNEVREWNRTREHIGRKKLQNV